MQVHADIFGLQRFEYGIAIHGKMVLRPPYNVQMVRMRVVWSRLQWSDAEHGGKGIVILFGDFLSASSPCGYVFQL